MKEKIAKYKHTAPKYLFFVINNCIQKITPKRAVIVTIAVCLVLICFMLVDTLLFYAASISALLLVTMFFILTLSSCLYLKMKCVNQNEKKNRDSDSCLKMLVELGLSENAINNLVLNSANNEIVLAEFDQNNRVLSYVGDIPYFSKISISSCDFMKRSRNKVELVTISENVALKKTYGSIKTFITESISLYILSHITNVPKLISLNPYKLTSYQSFIMGKSIGSELILHGATVSDQYQMDVHYQGPGKWDSCNLPSRAKFVRDLFRKETNDIFMSKLRVLIEQIHECGIIINDLKYGNVIKYKNEPYIIDFDRSNYFYFKNTKYLRKKNAERDKFNYFFSEDIPTKSVSI